MPDVTKNLSQVAAIKKLCSSSEVQAPKLAVLVDVHTPINNPTLRKRTKLENIQISTKNEDCLVVAMQLSSLYSSILVMNLANRYIAGGGWGKGDNAQEESIFYRTNYFQSFFSCCDYSQKTNEYQYKTKINHNTAYYSQEVTILYDLIDDNYHQLSQEKRIKINLYGTPH